MTENMDPKTLTQWSIGAGFLGIIIYIVALVLLWQGTKLFGGKMDHKDLYYAGSGLLYIAIWLKLGAIYHRKTQ